MAGLGAEFLDALNTNLTTLATNPTTFNGELTGSVDINAAFTLSSGYLVCTPRPADMLLLLLVIPPAGSCM